jgi:polar amino acid transport system substrate-binding protein
MLFVNYPKKASKFMRVTFLTLSLLLNLLNFAQADDTPIPAVVQISTEEYIPFTSTKLKYSGIFSRIVSEAFLLEGIEVEYAFYPAARSYMLAQSGRVNGTMPWAYRAEREADFLYSDPVLDVGEEYFFYRQDFEFNWDQNNLDYTTLIGTRFGAILTYDYGKAFQDAEAKGIINVYRVSSLKQLFNMLQKRRIDIVISKEWVAQYILQSEFTADVLAQLDSRPEVVGPASYDYLLFSKSRTNAQILMETFNSGLKNLRASGRYDVILKDLEKGEYLKP